MEYFWRATGVSVIGSVVMKAVHLSALLRKKYGVAFDRDCLSGLKILRKDRGQVLRRGRVVKRDFMRHPDFKGVDFGVAM